MKIFKAFEIEEEVKTDLSKLKMHEEEGDKETNFDENLVGKSYNPVINEQELKPKRYIPLIRPKVGESTSTKYVTNTGTTIERQFKVDSVTGQPIMVYYQTNTKNQSFMNMHYYLKTRGLTNNKFFLLLYDPDLANVDPYDPRLSLMMKQKIFVECQRNFFYYCREVVRVQSQGGPYVKYELNRGNLAMNFCLLNNLNIYAEQPRQTGKTITMDVWYSWVYNFGSMNGSILYFNKKHTDSKRNLTTTKEIIKNLPPYLRMDQAFGTDGKKLKGRDSVQYLQHKINHNIIEALPMATTREGAVSLIRGRTVTNCWIDESAFFKFLSESLQNGLPAMTRSFANCRANGAPHGLCLTSTPGYLTTENGKYMYELKNKMTPFSELWYDKTIQELSQIINANEKSIFIYIKYSYQQLGYSEEWLKERIKEQNQVWADIRREYLLEWATSSENCPFTQEQLKRVEKFVRQPKKQIYLGNYLFNLYEEYDPRIIPIIGVDVAAGYSRDSSAISCIDSTTTKLFADFNCNYINPVELSRLIYDLVTLNMPNALVVVERNGVGTGCLSGLMKSKIKHNLYYEVKERTIEEQLGGGMRVGKRKSWTKVYGLDNTKLVREQLMDLLEDRVENHFDKFISPITHKELCNLEYTKTGKIDHSADSHDDNIFSYLLALYPLYYGKNVTENWNIKIPTLKTAQDDAQEIFRDFNATEEMNIGKEIENMDNDIVTEQLEYLNSSKAMMFNDYIKQQEAEDIEALAKLLENPLARQAYAKKYNMDPDSLDTSNGQFDMSGVIDSFYGEDPEKEYNPMEFHSVFDTHNMLRR